MAIPSAHDKLLFTPGPLTTSQTVKQALLKDYGSRDLAFVDMVREIRHRLVELGGVSEQGVYDGHHARERHVRT